MSYEKNKKNVEIAAKWLCDNNYDVWLTATRERSDPAVKAIFGSVVVGTGAYIVTKDGKAYFIANSIDAQEGEQSGVFDETFIYGGKTKFEDVFSKVMLEKVAKYDDKDTLLTMNYSSTNAMADGMKSGLWHKLLKLFPEGYDFRTSEDLFELLDLT